MQIGGVFIATKIIIRTVTLVIAGTRPYVQTTRGVRKVAKSTVSALGIIRNYMAYKREGKIIQGSSD
jgi:hypothetical protein